jgi:hypothetical protein
MARVDFTKPSAPTFCSHFRCVILLDNSTGIRYVRSLFEWKRAMSLRKALHLDPGPFGIQSPQRSKIQRPLNRGRKEQFRMNRIGHEARSPGCIDLFNSSMDAPPGWIVKNGKELPCSQKSLHPVFVGLVETAIEAEIELRVPGGLWRLPAK